MFKVTLPFHLTLICFYYHYSFVSSGGSYFSINVYSIQQCASLNESQRLQTQDSTLAQLTLKTYPYNGGGHVALLSGL